MTKRVILGIVIGSIAILGGGAWLALRLPAVNGVEVENSAEANLSLVNRVADFGAVELNSGNVERRFEFTNVGSGDLVIANVATSCMCTKAIVKINRSDGRIEESPAFGMHEKSGWQGKVKPGETGEMLVIFDPAFHGPSGRGAISRVVKFNTNDNNNKEVEILLSGKVI